MAEIDFQPSKVEQQNIGKTTEAPVSNAQNEVNESRTNNNTMGRPETASQTEAMTKGPNPLLPAFDMSDFGPGAGTTNATKSKPDQSEKKEQSEKQNESSIRGITPADLSGIRNNNAGTDSNFSKRTTQATSAPQSPNP